MIERMNLEFSSVFDRVKTEEINAKRITDS